MTNSPRRRVLSCAISGTQEAALKSMNTRASRHFRRGGSQSVVLLMLALIILCGCAHRYKITLRNHQEIVTSSRPEFDNGTQTYRFKDSSGKEVVLPLFRIKDIEPY
jgi:hypothetical protein